MACIYCSVSGGKYFEERGEVVEAIINFWDEGSDAEDGDDNDGDDNDSDGDDNDGDNDGDGAGDDDNEDSKLEDVVENPEEEGQDSVSDDDNNDNSDDDDGDDDNDDNDPEDVQGINSQSSKKSDAEDSEGNDAYETKHFSNAVRKGLLHAQEDVDASSDIVILSCYKRLKNKIKFLYQDENAPPGAIKESNVTEVFNVTPGDDPDSGEFHSKDPKRTFELGLGSTVIMMYSAYLIVKQAAPRLKPHMILHLLYHPKLDGNGWSGCIPGIDYGAMTGIHEQDAFFPGTISAPIVRGDPKYLRAWKDLLTDKGKTDEEILYEAWRGRGNLWVFVRPDRFPIAETLAANPLFVPSGYSSVEMNPRGPSGLETFPPDILILICQHLPVKSTHMVLCTSKHLRSQILPHVNWIAYQHILKCEPHLLPVGPFKLNDEKRGREEVDWWNEQWAKGGIPKEELSSKIPWFLYRRECSKSFSMWNRRRIWGIGRQLEALAIKDGLLSPEDE